MFWIGIRDVPRKEWEYYISIFGACPERGWIKVGPFETYEAASAEVEFTIIRSAALLERHPHRLRVKGPLVRREGSPIDPRGNLTVSSRPGMTPTPGEASAEKTGTEELKHRLLKALDHAHDTLERLDSAATWVVAPENRVQKVSALQRNASHLCTCLRNLLDEIAADEEREEQDEIIDATAGEDPEEDS